MIAEHFMIAPFIAGMAGCVWASVCNERTYRYISSVTDRTYELRLQRLEAGLEPDAIPYPEDGTYARHFWRLFFFRRYDDLYQVKP